MKHSIKYKTLSPLLLLSGLLALSSCKLDGEDIGPLYGRWKLESISDPTGLLAQPELMFISFQGEVYQYQPNWQYDWGVYSKPDDKTLTLKPLSYMSAYGFHDLMNNDNYDGQHPVTFQIEQLDKNNMTWTRNDSVWVFKKFVQ